jgi:hypothetical protein
VNRGGFFSSDSGLDHAILIAGSLHDAGEPVVVGHLSLVLPESGERLEGVVLRRRLLAPTGR